MNRLYYRPAIPGLICRELYGEAMKALKDGIQTGKIKSSGEALSERQKLDGFICSSARIANNALYKMMELN